MCLNTKLLKFINMAKDLAINSTGSGNQKLCAIGLKNGKIQTIGLNQQKTHPIQALYAKRVGRPEKIYLHAEMDVLTRSKDIDTLIVVRVKKDGSFGISKPCPICENAIKERKLNVIYYNGTEFIKGL